MLLTPRAVLISVGHREQSVTVMAEIRKDFCEPAVIGPQHTSRTRSWSQSAAMPAGETGLKICTSGLIAAFAVRGQAPKNTQWDRDGRGAIRKAEEHGFDRGPDLLVIAWRTGKARSLGSLPCAIRNAR